MATTTAATATEIQTLYVAYFNRPADPLGLQAWQNSGLSMSAIAAGFSGSDEYKDTYAGKTNLDLVNSIYLNLFGRPAETAGLLFWAGRLQAGQDTFASLVLTIATNAQNEDKVAIDNKVAAATAFTTDIDTAADLLGYDGKAANAVVKAWLGTITTDESFAANTTTEAMQAVADAASVAHDLEVNPPRNVSLTTGTDALTGSAGADTFNAIESSTGATFTVGDAIDGGLGNDILNITQSGAITLPLNVSVKNVETANLVSATTGTSLNTTGWTGLTALNVVAPGAVTATAAATTAVGVTDAALAGSTITVNGGSDVTVTAASAVTGGTVNVGGTTAAAGNVTVTTTTTSTDGAGATTLTGAAINVTGGKAISVTSNLVATGGSNDAGDTITGGDITVTGSAATTSVTVSQTAAAARSTSGTGTAAIVDGKVVVADANSGSNSAAGTLTSVTLNSFGASSTVNSGALNSLTLSGKGVDLGVTSGSLTTPTATTLALNLAGVTTTGTVTLDVDYTTLNIAGTTGSNTLAGLTATGVTKLNVSGDKAVTLTQTLAALTDVVVTNSAGLTLNTALAAATKFTGGAGADSIKLSSGFTAAITTGAGDDMVTYAGAAGVGGSVDAGAGVDTISLTAGQAVTASGDAVFNGSFKGFEVLDIATGANTASPINLAGINSVNSVTTRGVAAGSTLTINGFTTGGTLTLDAAAGNPTTSEVAAVVTNATLTANDTFNVKLSNATAGGLAFGKVTVAGIETVNITATDAGTSTANKDATVDSLVLSAADATKVVVTGHDGLTLTNTGNTKIVTFDASGITADTTGDSAANLAVTFTSVNATANATVTIIGGEGNDVLTGNAAKDVITGGKGGDILTGGTGADVLNVGVGHDIVVFNSNSDTTGTVFTDSSTAAFDVVNGFKTVGTATSAVDFSSDANFIANGTANANLSLLKFGITVDDAAGTAGTVTSVVAAGDATGNGIAVGVTTDVTDGILTLGGTGASAVDTLAEWLTEAAAIASTAGTAIAFQFGTDTYVFVQNANADVLVELVGVTGATALQHTTGSTTAAAGTILFA